MKLTWRLGKLSSNYRVAVVWHGYHYVGSNFAYFLSSKNFIAVMTDVNI